MVNNVIDDLESDITDFMNSEELTLAHDRPGGENIVENSVDNASSRAEETIIRQMDDPETNHSGDSEVRHRKVTASTSKEHEHQNDPVNEPVSNEASNVTKKELTVKLKYLNDDLKLVQAQSTESLGDFKRRYFSEELAANKLVRLVFNGQVLQPDKKTLIECGLFDQCVVHCLIHNQKPNSGNRMNEPRSSSSTYGHNTASATTNDSSNGLGGLGSNNNIPSDSFLNRPEHGRWYLYISLTFISLTLLFCWFCRLQYAYLFSFYSTVGLVLMSILFVAMIPLIILIERDVVG